MDAGSSTTSPAGGRSPDPWPLSPELALVDPELAASARAQLPEPPPPPPRPGVRLRAAPALRVVPAAAAPPTPALLPAPGATRPVAALVAALVGVGLVGGFYLRPALWPQETPPSAAAPAPAIGRATPAPVAPAVKGVRSRASGPRQTAKRSGPVRPSQALPELVWPVVPGADAYRVSLFRGGRLVYSTVRTPTRLRLSATWVQHGKRRRLTPGTYRWVVWPLRRRGGKTVVERAIVNATLRV